MSHEHNETPKQKQQVTVIRDEDGNVISEETVLVEDTGSDGGCANKPQRVFVTETHKVLEATNGHVAKALEFLQGVKDILCDCKKHEV